MDADNLISVSSAFSKTSLNIWKFTVYILLKPGLENFEHSLPACDKKCNCVVVRTFFAIGIKTDLPSTVVTPEFSTFAGILKAALSQHHL